MIKFILFVAFLCFFPQIFSAMVHCEFEGMGGVSWIVVNFEDPDGDCKSDTYEVWHIHNDGNVTYTPWPEPGEPGPWGVLDFGRWDCCPVV